MASEPGGGRDREERTGAAEVCLAGVLLLEAALEMSKVAKKSSKPDELLLLVLLVPLLLAVFSLLLLEGLLLLLMALLLLLLILALSGVVGLVVGMPFALSASSFCF